MPIVKGFALIAASTKKRNIWNISRSEATKMLDSPDVPVDFKNWLKETINAKESLNKIPEFLVVTYET